MKSIFKRLGHGIWSVLKMMMCLVLMAATLLIYASYIEPELLVVHKEPLTTESIKVPSEGIKIVQFSDLHLGPDYDLQHLRRVVEKINALEPDLIVFTGDLVDDNKTFHQEVEAADLLKRLKAPLGKFAIYGNHDYGGNGHRKYAQMMEMSEFNLLVNEKASLKLSNGEALNVIGVDDQIFGEPNIPFVLKSAEETAYNIVLVHEPDLVDEWRAAPVDLQLSGHSHGGQVRLPIIGAPFTPIYAKIYIKGMYPIESHRRMQLYVNVGLGTSQMKYRFLNIPEITLFTLTNS